MKNEKWSLFIWICDDSAVCEYECDMYSVHQAMFISDKGMMHDIIVARFCFRLLQPFELYTQSFKWSYHFRFPHITKFNIRTIINNFIEYSCIVPSLVIGSFKI